MCFVLVLAFIFYMHLFKISKFSPFFPLFLNFLHLTFFEVQVYFNTISAKNQTSCSQKCCNCINLYPCILWDFIVLDLVLSWRRIEYELKISEISRLAHKKFMRRVPTKRAREKHMLEAEESSVRLHFASALRDWPSHEAPVKHSA